MLGKLGSREKYSARSTDLVANSIEPAIVQYLTLYVWKGSSDKLFNQVSTHITTNTDNPLLRFARLKTHIPEKLRA